MTVLDNPSTSNEQESVQVLFVPVLLPTDYEEEEANTWQQNWDDIENEAGSEDDDCATDEEDWRTMRHESDVDVWASFMSSTQIAGMKIKPTKRYTGTSKWNEYKRNKKLENAAEGSSPLSSYGFGPRLPDVAISLERAGKSEGKRYCYCCQNF